MPRGSTGHWRGKVIAYVMGAVGGVAALAIGCYALVAHLRRTNIERRVSASLVSPDGRWRAMLVEEKSFLDRNFTVRIQDTRAVVWGFRTIFASPDEGKPVGSERFLWSRDSKWLLLLGKKFFTRKSVSLASGEDLYLLFNAETGELWCNARQQHQHPSFGMAEIASIGFGEELHLEHVPLDRPPDKRTGPSAEALAPTPETRNPPKPDQ